MNLFGYFIDNISFMPEIPLNYMEEP